MLNCLRNAPSSSVSTTARFPHSSPGRSLRVLSSVPHARGGTQNDPPRMATAPLKLVANLAHLLQVAVRVGDKNPCAHP